MTIKKKALGKITKVEKGVPEKRVKKEDEKDLLEKVNLLDRYESYYDEDGDVDMAIE
jgi:hypothetical protein